MATNSEVPVALTIAGSDSSAGAGAQADLKTFDALGVYGLNAITCVVAETPGKVARIDGVAPEMISAQIEVLFDSFPIRAAKTGLLHSTAAVLATAKALRARAGIPLVVDPVMVATSGDLLLERDAVEACERELFPLAALLTPNLDEASQLLGRAIRKVAEMRDAVEALAQKYSVAVLLKGGHLAGDEALDLLFENGEIARFSAPFSRGVTTHGTGCTYSAAIAAGLASGLSLRESIARAKQFVTRAIAQHFTWRRPREVHALNHRAVE